MGSDGTDPVGAHEQPARTKQAPAPSRDWVIGGLRHALLQWFTEHGRPFPWRHPKHGAFESILAEMLLQRTRAETVGSFFTVFLERFPTWEALSEASEDEIGQFLKPIGLWRRRAASMAALSKILSQ